MTTNRCPFCDHENPVDAKFCGACGVLNLVPCPKCGAVNENSAKTCYRCHTQFKPVVADVRTAQREKLAEAVVERGEPPQLEPATSQHRPLVVLGAVLIAVITASFFLYRQRAATPNPVTVGSDAAPNAAPANAPTVKASSGGTAKSDPAPGSPIPAPAKESGAAPQTRASVAVTPEPVAAVPAPAAAVPVPAHEAAAPVADAAATSSSEPRKQGQRQSRVSVPGGLRGGHTKPPAQCTPAIAALGLCTMQSN